MSNDSKFLARVLRHAPDEIGLSLGEQGWVRVDELLRAIKKAGRPLTRSQLEEIVATNDKSRFTLRGDMIRAAQGHSIDVDLGLPALEPPETLYHGTASRNLDAIICDWARVRPPSSGAPFARSRNGVARWRAARKADSSKSGRWAYARRRICFLSGG
ncbi:phosphotransferase KptA/Tpt1 [Thioclava atlantica]|uniref:Phosphotransferase KptA/Tpt1 n=1 Tax=Thioclava atlantica TaxID=1317124 RepID=A0A085TYL8_9RHOB|nr:phosphotransferase KptA/Tpt1 [Thioclava atlantica]